MGDEEKKQARSNKQQGKATQHTQGSHFSKEKLAASGGTRTHNTCTHTCRFHIILKQVGVGRSYEFHTLLESADWNCYDVINNAVVSRRQLQRKHIKMKYDESDQELTVRYMRWLCVLYVHNGICEYEMYTSIRTCTCIWMQCCLRWDSNPRHVHVYIWMCNA